MRKTLLSVAACAAICSCAGLASAQGLLYDFEGGTDGFANNGGGLTVSADSVGATTGTGSLKVAVVPGATFVGALTGSVPAPLGDPPGVQAVLFDMHIAEAFAGAFADIGVTIFGASQPDYPGGQLFGLQAQFKDFVSVGGLAAGTYTDMRIDLDRAHSHPITFDVDQSFNQIFGSFGTGQNDVIPTGFQFFISKSSDAPVTVYFDNVRVLVPEPATSALVGLSMVAMGCVARRRRAS
jgi:hypothetical protein